MYKCLDCGEEFEEYQAGIIEYGTGAILSKVEYFTCPECYSIHIMNDDGKIQE